jgi:hypothetical protein
MLLLQVGRDCVETRCVSLFTLEAVAEIIVLSDDDEHQDEDDDVEITRIGGICAEDYAWLEAAKDAMYDRDLPRFRRTVAGGKWRVHLDDNILFKLAVWYPRAYSDVLVNECCRRWRCPCPHLTLMIDQQRSRVHPVVEECYQRFA